MASKFDTTQWTLVIQARDQPTEIARGALDKLCQDYWGPVYFYIRWKGFGEEEARDLAQEFFTRFLDRSFLKNVSPEKGRFRTFLMVTINHFIASEWRRSNTLKRGRGKFFVSLDALDAERLGTVPSLNGRTPEQSFERQWALTVLENALDRLEGEFRASGQTEEFTVLRDVLTGSADSLPYREIARRFGKTEGAVKVLVHRTRKRYGQLLREVVAETLTADEDVESELHHLFEVLDQ